MFHSLNCCRTNRFLKKVYSTCAPEFIDFSTEFEDIFLKKAEVLRIGGTVGGTTNSKYFLWQVVRKLISLLKAEIDV